MADGLSSWCRRCHVDEIRKQYNKNRAHYLDYAHRYYRKNKNRILGYYKDYVRRKKGKIRSYKKSWRIKNRERLLENGRKYYISNRTKILKMNKEWKEKNPGRYYKMSRDYTLRTTYGIDYKNYRELYKIQAGSCKICGTKNPGGHGTFHVDHDHETREIRGLLCVRCNAGLGYFRDNADVIRKAIRYLLKAGNVSDLKIDPIEKKRIVRYKNNADIRGRLKRTYGITLEQYNSLFAKQGRRCGICGTRKPDSRGRWKLDHHHKSGVIRGILCCGCNFGIGFFGDDISLLRKAVRYLVSN